MLLKANIYGDKQVLVSKGVKTCQKLVGESEQVHHIVRTYHFQLNVRFFEWRLLHYNRHSTVQP